MSVTPPPLPIVVGVDGSPQALHAVRYGALEAARRHRPLRIVHAFIWPLFHVPVERPDVGPPEAGLRNQARLIVDHAVEAAAEAQPSVHVTGVVVTGAPAPILIAESRDAEMVVIGDRGLGGFAGLLVGSAAVQTASHGGCPVLVVRGDATRSGPVVVGVDGSSVDAAAVKLAFVEASWRGVPVHAVHSTHHGDLLVRRNAEGDQEHLFAAALANPRARHPDVPVTAVTVTAPPAEALLAAAEDAQLVVVGTRGRGGFTGLILGSTSHAVLHHATCPTAVVGRSDR